MLLPTCCIAHLAQRAADQLQQPPHLASARLVYVQLAAHSARQLLCN
jgi:hypothetical protein